MAQNRAKCGFAAHISQQSLGVKPSPLDFVYMIVF